MPQSVTLRKFPQLRKCFEYCRALSEKHYVPISLAFPLTEQVTMWQGDQGHFPKSPF